MSLSGTAPSSVPVRTARGGYPVLVGAGLLDRLPELLREHAPAYRYAVISDDRVAELYGSGAVQRCRARGLRADLFSFPRGEASKNRAEWARLTDALLSAGMGRDAVVVAVGGGVTGDLAGFVAATYLRGVPVVQVPTSLVAMIDASVGGKTGVDVDAGKNLVGAFHPPRVVVADPRTVATLPRTERAQGLAEALKHGAILDADYLDRLVAEGAELMEGEEEAVHAAVLRSVQLKARVVGEDEREAGIRQILNFGHTLGHVLEAASGYALGHGSAVAAGMVLEAELGERVGVSEPGTREALERALEPFGLGGVPALDRPLEELVSYLSADKKARAGRPRFVLLERPGTVSRAGGWSREVDDGAVRALLGEALAGGVGRDAVESTSRGGRPGEAPRSPRDAPL
jgi:3-dehydroquinate synthase